MTTTFNQHFKGYEILGELGRGNARVLKARHQWSGDLVAIKHFAFNTDAETIRRFQRESEIMTSIQHPNIVKVREVQLDAMLPYLVMELVEGGDLRGLLRQQGRLDTATVISLAMQMTEAFESIHGRHITHRDIKPENIMCRLLPGGGMHFLLTDFGIARLREQPHTVTGGAMMTYEYASPEQFDNPKSATAATDYYSLGVVLYECLSGQVPFPLTDGRMHAFVNQVMTAEPPLLANAEQLPPSLIRLIKGLLVKDAAVRICSLQETRHLLQQAASEIIDKPVLKRTLTSEQHKTLVTLAAPAFIQPSVTEKAPVQKTVKAPQKQKSQPAPTTYKSTNKAASWIFLLSIMFVGAAAAGVYYIKRHNRRLPSRQTTIEPRQTSAVKEKTIEPLVTPDTGFYIPEADTINGMNGDTYLPDNSSGTDNTAVANTANFFDDFSSNANAWPLLSDADGYISVQEGKMIVRGVSDEYSYPSSKHFDINTDKDFSVSATAKWQKGLKEDGFGIDFCCNENNSSGYNFSISADGAFCIRYNKNDGDWKTLKDWTDSGFINTNKQENTLSISKHSGLFHFFVNGEQVATMPYEGSFGSNFGIRVAGTQTVEFDDFKVEGTKS